jgi:hypothetical protein
MTETPDILSTDYTDYADSSFRLGQGRRCKPDSARAFDFLGRPATMSTMEADTSALTEVR